MRNERAARYGKYFTNLSSLFFIVATLNGNCSYRNLECSSYGTGTAVGNFLEDICEYGVEQIADSCREDPLRADGTLCDELRWVRHVDQELPKTKIKAHHYFLSPHFDGEQINYQNLGWCMNQCLQNPKWRISVQQHKLWRIR